MLEGTDEQPDVQPAAEPADSDVLRLAWERDYYREQADERGRRLRNVRVLAGVWLTLELIGVALRLLFEE